MTRAEWFALPLALRQRWWRETNYGAIPPSTALAREIKRYHNQKEKEMRQKSRIRRNWEEELDRIEEHFLCGEYDEEQAKRALANLLPPGAAEDAWSVLYDMRKHDLRYGS